jgi:hypothetical protein
LVTVKQIILLLLLFFFEERVPALIKNPKTQRSKYIVKKYNDSLNRKSELISDLGANYLKEHPKITSSYIGSHPNQISTTTKNKRWLIYAIKRKTPIISEHLNRQPADLTNNTASDNSTPTNEDGRTLHLKQINTTKKPPKQRLCEGREEPPTGKNQVIQEPPADVVGEGGRVARDHHASGRSLARACHTPMWKRRWGTRRTLEDSEDADESNGEVGIVQ